jgi:alpha-ketoglutarate-dependent taurine dioxygenase
VTLISQIESLDAAHRDALQSVAQAGWSASELQPFGIELRCSDSGTLCEFASLDADALSVLAWRHGHVVLSQVRALNQSDMEAQAARFGPLLRWNFGFTFHVKPERNFKSTVASRGSVPLHFDGMFYTNVPRFQLFQCITPPDNGGETTFVHTVPLARALSPELRAELRRTSVKYYTPHLDYFGGAVTEFPLLRAHPNLLGADVLLHHQRHEGDVTQPVRRTVATERERALLDDVEARVFDARFVRYHTWSANQFVLADNVGQLHGRRGFGDTGDRLLYRIHVL